MPDIFVQTPVKKHYLVQLQEINSELQTIVNSQNQLVPGHLSDLDAKLLSRKLDHIVTEMGGSGTVQTPLFYAGVNYTTSNFRVLLGPTYTRQKVNFLTAELQVGEDMSSCPNFQGFGTHIGFKSRNSLPVVDKRVQIESEMGYCFSTGYGYNHGAAKATLQSGKLVDSRVHYSVNGKLGVFYSKDFKKIESSKTTFYPAAELNMAWDGDHQWSVAVTTPPPAPAFASLSRAPNLEGIFLVGLLSLGFLIRKMLSKFSSKKP